MLTRTTIKGIQQRGIPSMRRSLDSTGLTDGTYSSPPTRRSYQSIGYCNGQGRPHNCGRRHSAQAPKSPFSLTMTVSLHNESRESAQV